MLTRVAQIITAAQIFVILQTDLPWSHTKIGHSDLLYGSKSPMERWAWMSILKPAEPHRPWDVCWAVWCYDIAWCPRLSHQFSNGACRHIMKQVQIFNFWQVDQDHSYRHWTLKPTVGAQCTALSVATSKANRVDAWSLDPNTCPVDWPQPLVNVNFGSYQISGETFAVNYYVEHAVF